MKVCPHCGKCPTCGQSVECQHDWYINPNSAGAVQRCRKCGITKPIEWVIVPYIPPYDTNLPQDQNNNDLYKYVPVYYHEGGWF